MYFRAMKYYALSCQYHGYCIGKTKHTMLAWEPGGTRPAPAIRLLFHPCISCLADNYRHTNNPYTGNQSRDPNGSLAIVGWAKTSVWQTRRHGGWRYRKRYHIR